jgi:hypothetical protein
MMKNIVIAVLVFIVVCEALIIRADDYGRDRMAEDHANLHIELEGDSRRAVMIKGEDYDMSDARQLIDHLAAWQYEEPKLISFKFTIAAGLFVLAGLLYGCEGGASRGRNWRYLVLKVLMGLDTPSFTPVAPVDSTV